MLNRDLYLSRIQPFYDAHVVKFLVGMRGSGKSSLFLQIMSDLKSKEKTDDSHIIHINLEFLDNDKIKNSTKFETYISNKIADENMYYIFLDEIQYLPQFEIALINLLEYFENISFFASSSNSRLLIENLNSNIRTKCKIFYITPFSYFETCKFLNTDSKNKNMLINYLKYGGLPERLLCKKSSEVKKFLYSLLDSIFLRDIVMRLGIFDIDNMNDVAKCIVQHIGNDFYFENIKADLNKIGKQIPDEQLYTDFDCLCKALVIQGVNNYNVRTDQIYRSVSRYYIGDLGLRFVYGLDVENNMEAILKNLVWLELKRRGYDVYTGINGEEKIDFVAIRKRKYMYIRVMSSVEDGNTANKEVENLSNFDFNGKRYLLSLDNLNYSRKGVIHKHIIDFILEGESDIESLDEPDFFMTVD